MPEIIDASSAIEQYVVLAKMAKGRSACELIVKAISDPSTYVFGELLSSSSISELLGSEHENFVHLLRIFAYGTYSEYKSKMDTLPGLSTFQQNKLKQLSIVSLANYGKTKTLSYDTLLSDLDMDNVRELEDLLIESMYSGLIVGKMDQKNRCIEIHSSMGRDIQMEEIPQMSAILANWCKESARLMQTLEQGAVVAAQKAAEAKEKAERFAAKSEEMKKSVKTALELESANVGPGTERRRGGGTSGGSPEEMMDSFEGEDGMAMMEDEDSFPSGAGFRHVSGSKGPTGGSRRPAGHSSKFGMDRDAASKRDRRF